MNTALGHHPRSFQRNVIPYVLAMNNSVEHPIHPILLVQGDGGGKLSVYQTIGVIKRGVSLIIENTLLLSSDQLSKIKNISKQLPNAHSFQLDLIKTKPTCINLANQIKNLQLTSSTTIFLFASPESLLSAPWLLLIQHTIGNNILRQICIDKVHFYINLF